MRELLNNAARLFLLTLLLAVALPALAAEPDAEIEYLLESIGSSDCTFIRNGTRHSAEKAVDHLRMKYNRTRRYIKDADTFIDKLASESSWTGKPYTIECPGEPSEPSRAWLTTKLQAYRDNPALK